jgi:hypothetical protein
LQPKDVTKVAKDAPDGGCPDGSIKSPSNYNPKQEEEFHWHCRFREICPRARKLSTKLKSGQFLGSLGSAPKVHFDKPNNQCEKPQAGCREADSYGIGKPEFIHDKFTVPDFSSFGVYG